ncbi:Flavin prenyltransferase UbiX [Candidatus Hartigia pinicola]|nr:Flavin prenyltransferase UbiX [Candidatus Hartigia pinicola]
MKKLIIGFTGASGAIYSVKILEILQSVKYIETHVIMSPSSYQTLSLETSYNVQDIQKLADYTYDNRDISAAISSGSFHTVGMIIMPCTIKTLSGIAHSYTDTLMTRAADVVLKENKRLILGVRETPLHLGHLRLLVQAAEIGAVIMPPMPAFYHKPKTIQDIIYQTINRVLDQFDIKLQKDLFCRWKGEG